MRWTPKDLLLRGCGLLLIAAAVAAVQAMPAPSAVGIEGAAGGYAYLLAVAAFLFGSAGAGFLGWGAHLFDRVTRSSRWQQYQAHELDG